MNEIAYAWGSRIRVPRAPQKRTVFHWRGLRVCVDNLWGGSPRQHFGSIRRRRLWLSSPAYSPLSNTIFPGTKTKPPTVVTIHDAVHNPPWARLDKRASTSTEHGATGATWAGRHRG